MKRPSNISLVRTRTTDDTTRYVLVKSHNRVAYDKHTGLSLHHFKGDHYVVFSSTGSRLPITGKISESLAIRRWEEAVQFEREMMEEEGE